MYWIQSRFADAKEQFLEVKTCSGHTRRHCAVSCAKMDEQIEMPFGFWARVGRMRPYVKFLWLLLLGLIPTLILTWSVFCNIKFQPEIKTITGKVSFPGFDDCFRTRKGNMKTSYGGKPWIPPPVQIPLCVPVPRDVIQHLMWCIMLRNKQFKVLSKYQLNLVQFLSMTGFWLMAKRRTKWLKIKKAYPRSYAEN